MSLLKLNHQEENLSPSSRRTVVGLTEFTETAVFEHPQKLGRGKRKSLLPIALAGLLVAFFPATDAAAQACTQTTVISTASAAPVESSADGECIKLPSSGDVANRISATHDNVKITIDGKIEHDSYGFQTIDASGNNVEVKVGRSGSVVANKSKHGIETRAQGARVIVEGKVMSVAPSGLGSGTGIWLANGGYLEIRESGLVSSDGQGGPGIGLTAGGTVVVAGSVEQKVCTAGPGLCPSTRLAINSGVALGDATIILLPRSRISGDIRLQERSHQKNNIIKIGPGYYSGSSSISRSGWVRIDGNVVFISGSGGEKEFHLNSNQGVRISGDLTGAKLVRIEKGDLIFAGHIDLGTTGVVDVYQNGRLTFEIGENAAGDANTYGRLTAGTLNLVDTRSDPDFSRRIYTGFKEGLDETQISAIKSRLPTRRASSIGHEGDQSGGQTIITAGQISFVKEPSGGVRNSFHNLKDGDRLVVSSGSPDDTVAALFLEESGNKIIGKVRFTPGGIKIKTLRTSTVTGSTRTRVTVTGGTVTGGTVTGGTVTGGTVTGSTVTGGTGTGTGDTGGDDTGDGDTGDGDTGDGDTGDGDTGDGDTGDGDTGGRSVTEPGDDDGDTGDGDTGDGDGSVTEEPGDGDTGDGDTGDGDTGDGDTGDGDTGDGDTGDGDTGDGDTGDGDTGDGDGSVTEPGDGDTGDEPSTGDGDTGDGDTGDGDTGDGPGAEPATGDETVEPGIDATGTGGGSSSGAIGLGLLALLIGNFVDLEDPEDAQFGSYFVRSKQTVDRSGQIRFQTGRGAWAQAAQSRYSSYGASYLNASGSRIGWELYRSGSYFLNATLAPRTSAAPGGHRGSAKGHLLSLSAGWKDSGRYLGLGLSRGRFDADSMLYDGTTKGYLRGNSSFDYTRASLTARNHMEIGPVKTAASVSLFGGEISQSAYGAGNSVMTAEIPAWRQRYSGSTLGLSLSSRNQLALLDSVSVSPHLKVSASRVSAGASDAVMIRQSDRAGVLSFEKTTVLQGVPESLNTLSFGADIKPMNKRRGVFRVGYAGMEADGDYEHAAVAAYRLRF